MFEIQLFWHLTECKQKTILILNWIVWNRTVYVYKNGFGINNLQWLMCHQTKPIWWIKKKNQIFFIHEEKVKKKLKQNANFTRKNIALINWVLKCNVYSVYYFFTSLLSPLWIITTIIKILIPKFCLLKKYTAVH